MCGLLIKKPRNRMTSEGFSLVELMVAVAIAGVLAVVAAPRYSDLIDKVRMGNAKALLGAFYTAEKIFYAEYESYSTRLDAIGFSPDGAVYFNIGFRNDFPPPPGVLRGSPTCNCLCYNTGCAMATTWVCAPSAGFSTDGSNLSSATRTTFTVEAHAHLDGAHSIFGAAARTFTINHNKVLIQYMPAN